MIRITVDCSACGRALLVISVLFLSACGGGSTPPPATATSTMVTTSGVPPCGIEGSGIHIQDCNAGGDQSPPPVTGLSMTTARAEHTATPLPDGKVLIAGGAVWAVSHGFSATASAELYDPSAGSFSPTGDMNTARGEHVAALLADGRVLLAGGLSDFKNYTYFVSAEIYDPATGTFTPTGNMVSSGRVASAVLLPDGRILIGQDGNSAEIYDPAAGTFTLTGAYGSATVEVDTAMLLPNGTVLVVGCAANCSVGMTALFDPKTDRFNPTGSRQAWSTVSNGTVLTDGTVLFVEGNDSALPDDVEIYDPTAGAFTHIGHTHDVHEFSTATRLPDGSVLIAGGQLAGGNGNPAVELYAPATRTFTSVTNLSTGRHNHTATLLPNGAVLVAGGYSVWPYPTPSAEIYR
jgi:Galactose oxidase, central domain